MSRLTIVLTLLVLYACKPVETENIHLNAFEYIPFEKVADLDKVVRETSGMTKDMETIWTQNDSGNPNEIYQIDLEGEIVNQVIINGTDNTDWEDLTSDSTHLYIGNFGNNVGQRKDLIIYGLPLDSLATTSADNELEINFSYADQVDFPGNYDHNFDCEAMVSYGDSLYLFSKSWKDQICMMYKLPKTSGNYTLTAVDQFNTKGVITGAALSPLQDRLCLVGYNFSGGVMDPFIWVYSNFEGDDFFGGDAVRYNLKSKRQMEAVEWVTDSLIYISAEHEGKGSPTLFKAKI